MRLKMFFLQLFAHEHQERWSKLVLAKLRDTLVLKDGVVFNNDYEGKQKTVKRSTKRYPP